MIKPANRYPILLLIALMFSACVRIEKKKFAGPGTGADRATCEANGGKIERVCGDGYLACVAPYPDGGKPCADSSECFGTCSVPASQSVFPPGKNKGTCQRSTVPCDCYRKVIHGEVQRAGICPA